MKKVLLIIMMVCMIATMGIANARADWFMCNVIATGTSNAGATTMINLTDQGGQFTKWWFTLNSTNANQQLATALTAISSGMPVYVFFDGTGTPPGLGVVQNMYLNSGSLL